MIGIKSLGQETHAQERAHLYQKKHHQDPSRTESHPPLSIALSREAGTPVVEVAEEVGRLLGWQVHDRDILKSIGTELGMDVSVIERFDERRQSWLLECLEAFSTGSNICESVYVSRLVKLVRSLASDGHCVFVGRGSAQFLPGRSTLRIRLIGSRHDRTTTLMRRLGLRHAEAERRLEEIDQERARFIKDHFGHDPRDTHHYDLVLNTSHLTPAECARLIVEAAHQHEAVVSCRVVFPTLP